MHFNCGANFRPILQQKKKTKAALFSNCFFFFFFFFGWDFPFWGMVQVNGLPFNKYSWIVTHNSFSIVDATPLPGVQRLTFYNQEDTVTNQLRV